MVIFRGARRRLTGATSLLEQPGSREIVRFREGLFLAGTRNKIEAKLLGGSYDPVNLTFCRGVVGTGNVCIDVGANIGVYSTLFGIWVGPDGAVHAFEPVAHVRRRLHEHLVINGLRNVSVNPIGLAEQDGTLSMRQVREGEYRGGTSSFTANENIEALGADRFDRVDVSVLRLDTYVESSGLGRLNFAKIDVEGFELNCLSGGIRTLERFRPVVLLEHSQRRLEYLGIDESRFADLASQAGYRFYELRGIGRRIFLIAFDFDRRLRSSNIVGLPEERAVAG